MPPNAAFRQWLDYSQSVRELPVGQIVLDACATGGDDAVRAAYDAPYPDESYKAGARIFPALVPDPAGRPGVRRRPRRRAACSRSGIGRS